ncbi:unnamed protein product [Prunus armeniaca]
MGKDDEGSYISLFGEDESDHEDGVFYDTILKMSVTLHPASHTTFHDLIAMEEEIEDLLMEYEEILSETQTSKVLKDMTLNMKLKFKKYWGDLDKLNQISMVALVLDPQYKLENLEFILKIRFKNLEDAVKKKNEIKEILKKFYAATTIHSKYITDPIEDVIDEVDVLKLSLFAQVSSNRFLAKIAKKNSNFTTIENVASGSRKVSALWYAQTIAIFIDLCIKEMDLGNRPDTHFNKIEWARLVEPKYAKFQFEGINPEMEEKLYMMFLNVTATGKHSWAPSSSVLPVESDDDVDPLEVNDGSNESMPIETTHTTNNVLKKRTNQSLEIEDNNEKKGKRGGKMGGAAKLSQQIERLVEVVESRSTGTSMANTVSQGTSIAEMMKDVATLPGAKRGSKLWWFATKLFCAQEKRDMFVVMEDPNLKLQFLNHELVEG